MKKRCAKCRRDMDAELFICPHCGAIYGEPVHRYKQVRDRIHVPWRKLVAALIAVLIICVAVFAWEPLTERIFSPWFGDDMYVPVGDSVGYSVKVVNQHGGPIEGAVVLFTSEKSDEIMRAETDESGYASILHNRDKTLRAQVIGWPADMNCNIPEPLAFGNQTHLTLILSTYHLGLIPATTTPSDTQPTRRELAVRVVDSRGNPVEGAHVATDPYSSTGARQTHLSDENGFCYFQVTGACYAQLQLLPNHYYSDWQRYALGEEDTELTITVFDINEVQPADGKAVYTVALRSEDGKPIYKSSVILNCTVDGVPQIIQTYTNEDGTVSFLCDCSDEITADVYLVKGAKQYAVQLRFQNGETFVEWTFY